MAASIHQDSSHFGWDNSIAPVLEIESGEDVEFEVRDASGGQLDRDSEFGAVAALNFERVGDRVATTGDFVLIASEVNPVIRELRTHGIAVTALHSHMLEETPRLFFMHFWGVDTPDKIASALKAALAKVNTKP